jgi:hypothetical protein
VQAQGSIKRWISGVFEQAATVHAGATHETAPHRQQQQLQALPPHAAHRQGVLCKPMRRPLPAATVVTLCDRRGAALRQQLTDAAAAVLSRCGGRLPLVRRRFLLPDDPSLIDDGVPGGAAAVLGRGSGWCELLREDVPLSEWLWQAQPSSDHTAKRVLHAADGGDDGAAAAEDDGRHHNRRRPFDAAAGDLQVLETT